MQDFSKAEVSRNHNTSFKASIKTALEFIDDLNQTYQTCRDELEVLRKERAAIIENIIQVLKNKKVKINKPLGKCNNFEINEELLKVIDKLDFREREKFQCDLIRINNRYARITELGKKLEDVSNALSTLHVPESDYSDELVIDLNPNNEPVKERKELKPVISEPVIEEVKLEPIAKPVKQQPVVEEVVSEPIDEVVEEVVEDFDNIPILDDVTVSIPIVPEETIAAAMQEEKEEIIEEVVKPVVEEVKEKPKKNTPSILEDSDLFIDSKDTRDTSLDIDNIPGITKTETLVEKALSTYNETKVDVEEEEEDFLFYEINNGVTLEEIAKSVYEDGSLWADIYRYDINKGLIDRTAAKLKLTVKETCTTPGALDGIKLKFPVELITYEEITN